MNKKHGAVQFLWAAPCLTLLVVTGFWRQPIIRRLVFSMTHAAGPDPDAQSSGAETDAWASVSLPFWVLPGPDRQRAARR